MVAHEQGMFYRPKSSVELVLDGHEIQDYIRDITSLMEDGSRWGGTSLRYRAAEFNCLAFRLGVGGATITHDRIIQPSLSRPMRTYVDAFASVDDTECGISYMSDTLIAETDED